MTPCTCVIWYGHFSVLHSLEYTLLKIWQLIHYETYQSTVSFIPTFVHYLLRFYIQGLKYDDPSFCHGLSSCKPSFSHFHYQELVVPHPPLHPQNNTFFPSPCETSLVFYQASFIQASCSLPCQCCLLENQKYCAVLCMLINKAVGFFPQGLKVSPPPDWGLEFQLHSWTWVSQLQISLGKVEKKKIRKLLQQQMSWG